LEERLELCAHRIAQHQEVDLVSVLVLNDAPGEAAGVQEASVEPDLACDSVRGDPLADVDHDPAGHEIPVEAAGA